VRISLNSPLLQQKGRASGPARRISPSTRHSPIDVARFGLKVPFSRVRRPLYASAARLSEPSDRRLAVRRGLPVRLAAGKTHLASRSIPTSTARRVRSSSQSMRSSAKAPTRPPPQGRGRWVEDIARRPKEKT
jgi:hypothetical protein